MTDTNPETQPETEPVNPAPVEEVPATDAAVAHAKETGVDLTAVEGTGKGGTVTKADVAAVASSKSYHYCLAENHPGVPNFQSQPLDVGRIFSSSEDPPVCPACGQVTNSVPCEGPDMPPESVVSLQERFGR